MSVLILLGRAGRAMFHRRVGLAGLWSVAGLSCWVPDGPLQARDSSPLPHPPAVKMPLSGGQHQPVVSDFRLRRLDDKRKNALSPVSMAGAGSGSSGLITTLGGKSGVSDQSDLVALQDRHDFIRHFPQWDVLQGYWGQDRSSVIERAFGAAPLPPQHILPDHYAIGRRFFLEHGVNIQLTYKGAPIWAMDGGNRRGVAYAQQIVWQMNTDLGRLTHGSFLEHFLEGVHTHTAIYQRAGRSVGRDYVGDYSVKFANIYGGGGNVLQKLGFFYVDRNILNRRANVAIGRMPVGINFATSPIYHSFLTTGSNPLVFKRSPGYSSAPLSVWGGRIRLRPAISNYLSFGVYQVNPNYGGRAGWSWFKKGSTGAVFPIEDMWTPYFGHNGLVGHYKIGFGYNTTRYATVEGEIPPAAQGRIRHAGYRHNKTFWLLADQMLWRNGKTETSGAILFGGYVHNTDSIANFRDEVFGGVIVPNSFLNRYDDQLGFSLTHYKFSSTQRHGQEIRMEYGIPLNSTLFGPQSDETVMELFYGFPLYRGIRMQPDYQYVIHPGASTHLPNASLLGFKLVGVL